MLLHTCWNKSNTQVGTTVYHSQPFLWFMLNSKERTKIKEKNILVSFPLRSKPYISLSLHKFQQ